MNFSPVAYGQLNARQKENYNFHKIAARLADFGFTSLRLSDDFEGADFVALHVDGETLCRVQLKSRLTIDRKYLGKGLYIAFRLEDRVFVYPHDAFVDRVLEKTSVGASKSWAEAGLYTWPRLSAGLEELLRDYEI